MSQLVLHLVANEGAQFIGNQRGGAIAGGLALVEKSKIPKFEDGSLIESKMLSIQDNKTGKQTILFSASAITDYYFFVLANHNSEYLLAANEIANIKMLADIRLMPTHFIIGRPGSEAGSQFYGKLAPLSAEGAKAETLQLELQSIANKWLNKSCTKGDTNYLYSKNT